MEITTGWQQILSQSLVYDLMQRCIGGYTFKRRFLASHLGEAENETVLELGCGTGFAATCLPEALYTGIDISEKYIRAAKRRGLPLAKFIVCNCIEPKALNGQKYDWIISNGLMHHLPTEKCNTLLTECSKLLEPDGTFLGMEPVWIDTQSALERLVMKTDRGKNILTIAKWQELFARSFEEVKIQVVSRSLRIPYSLILFKCRQARGIAK